MKVLLEEAVKIDKTGETYKPILDIAVVVRSGETIPLAVTRLAEAGYIDRVDLGPAGCYLLIKDSKSDVHAGQKNNMNENLQKSRSIILPSLVSFWSASEYRRQSLFRNHGRLSRFHDFRAYSNKCIRIANRIYLTEGYRHFFPDSRGSLHVFGRYRYRK
jgi:hypothetical protein